MSLVQFADTANYGVSPNKQTVNKQTINHKQKVFKACGLSITKENGCCDQNGVASTVHRKTPKICHINLSFTDIYT